MIESRQNPRLKEIRRLRRARGPEALLEGPRLVEEARRLGISLETVLATPEFLATDEGRALAPALDRPPLEVASPLLRGVSDADSPQGILAVARLERGGVEALPLVERGVYLYLDGLQDPGNLGALARTGEAAGAAGLALGAGCAHPTHPRALRASAGSLLRLPVAVGAEPEALSSRLEPLAPRWAALVPRGGTGLWEAELEGPLVLALGAEGPGLSEAVARRCELEVSVPVAGDVESLNATVAAALVLFEIRRRRR